MEIPSIFMKIKRKKQPWKLYWPSCKNPKTLSFRACHDKDVFMKYHDHDHDCGEDCKQSSLDQTTAMITGVRLSDRLFFEAHETSSILHEKGLRNVDGVLRWPFWGGVAWELESENPYLDFKESMQEMVKSQLGLVNLKDDGINWEWLEALLGWYLRMNLKTNHGFIVQAFVDLIVGLASN